MFFPEPIEDNMTIQEIVQQSKASQNKVEWQKVLQFVGEIHPKVIVEIGTHRGFSALDFFKAFDPELLITIEIDPHEVSDEFNQLPDGRVHLVEGNSHTEEIVNKVADILGDRYIDFLYIDGDHHYDAVKADFEMYEPLVRVGGIIGLDDIMLNDPRYVLAGVEVNRFWNELIRIPSTKYYEFWDQSQIAGFGTGDGLWYKPEAPKVPVVGIPQIGNL